MWVGQFRTVPVVGLGNYVRAEIHGPGESPSPSLSALSANSLSLRFELASKPARQPPAESSDHTGSTRVNLLLGNPDKPRKRKCQGPGLLFLRAAGLLGKTKGPVLRVVKDQPLLQPEIGRRFSDGPHLAYNPILHTGKGEQSDAPKVSSA